MNYIYDKYIKRYWKGLAKLKPLSFDEIALYNDPCRMYLYVYYGFTDYVILNYSIDQLNKFINTENDNLYFLAVAINNIDFMIYLESQGFNINYTNNRGANSYSVAIFHSKIKTMKYLESRGANINIIDNLGDNAYSLAIICDNVKKIKYLESKGLDTYFPHPNDGPFLYAAKCGSIKAMKYLKNHVDINYTDEKDNNAYLVAAVNRKLKSMKYLESIGFNIYIINKFGFNSFSNAYSSIFNSDFKTMKYLENRGLNILTKATDKRNVIKIYGLPIHINYIVKNGYRNLINIKEYLSNNMHIKNTESGYLKHFRYKMNMLMNGAFFIYLFI